MSGKTCLVTGASGYIGSRLVRRLIDRGYQPAVILRPSSSLKHLQEIGIHDVTRFDYLGSIESLKDAIEYSNIVFHLATANSYDHRIDTVDDMLDAKVRFGMHILEALRTFSVSGSNNFIGTGTSQQDYPTETLGSRAYYYSLTKAFDEIAKSYMLENIEITMLRPHDNYGPTDYRNKVIPAILKACITGKDTALSDGLQSLDILYIDDILDAYIWAGFEQDSWKSTYRYYDVIANEVITIRDIVKTFQEIAISENIQGLHFDTLKWGEIPRRPEEHEPYISNNLVPSLKNRTALYDGLKSTLLGFIKFYQKYYA